MNASRFSTSTSQQVSRTASVMTRLLCGVLLAAVAAGCAHRDPGRKKRLKTKQRDPIEQKVFYDGWWPR